MTLEGGYYILGGDDGMTPVEVGFSIEGWAKWMEEHQRTVAFSSLEPGLTVSTVFLGIDHAFFPGLLHVFETMSFGPIFDGELYDRYATWDDAVAGHVAAVDKLYEELQRLRKIDHPVVENPP